MKKAIIAVVAVFILWSALDFVLHGMLLAPVYQATASLWRPMDQMNMPLMYLVTLAFAVGFTAIYWVFASEKSLASGLQYGALFGLTTGTSMGFGSYAYMPIPLTLALAWFVGTVVEAMVAGALIGTIMKTGK